MEPSQRNLSAAAVAVAVFLLVVTAGTCIVCMSYQLHYITVLFIIYINI